MRTTHGAQRQTATRFGLAFALMAALLAGVFSLGTARAQVEVSSVQPYTQNFDSLSNIGSSAWQNDITLKGWYAVQGQNAITNYTAYDNTDTDPDQGLYSFGPSGGTDRALGVIGGGGGQNRIGVLLQNTSGVAISQMQLGYTGEQWLAGAAINQRLDFDYKVGTTVRITDTGFFDATALDSLEFQAISATTSGDSDIGTPLNGNAAANRVVKAPVTITLNTPLQPNQYVMFRWSLSPANITGKDNGLAVDDLSINAVINNPAPPVPNCPSPLTTAQGTAASEQVSASDPNDIVTSAAITSGATTGISLTNPTPATTAGGTYTATLNVASTVAAGSYNVGITFNSSSGETATCTVAVTVTGSNTGTANFGTSTKTVDKTQAAPGDEVTYTITLTNSGQVQGTFLLTDTLDANLTLVSAPGLVATGQTLRTSGSVNSGQTQQYTIVARVNAGVADGTTIGNSATLSSGQQVTLLPAPNVTVASSSSGVDFSDSTKTVDETEVAPGDEVTYTITLTNSGQAQGTFLLTDTLDANLTLVSAPGLVATGQTLRTSGTVDAGQSREYTIIARVNANVADGTVIRNSATLSSNGQVSTLTAPNVTVTDGGGEDGFEVYLPLIRK